VTAFTLRVAVKNGSGWPTPMDFCSVPLPVSKSKLDQSFNRPGENRAADIRDRFVT
jgi:hypothetical protein